MRKLVSIFFRFFCISLFVLGGGYVIIAVAEKIFSKSKDIEEGELIDSLPIFQMIPGIIAAHTAVFVGNKIAGFRGSVAALFGAILPSILIFSFVAAFYSTLPVWTVWLFLPLKIILVYMVFRAVANAWKKADKTPYFYFVTILSLAAVSVFKVPIPAVLAVSIASGFLAEYLLNVKPSAGRRFFSFPLVAFLCFLKYGLLGFGGGFVLVPMYFEDFVGAAAPFLQLPASDFSNIIALTQITPGPIGINAATYFGYRLSGFAGAFLSSVLLVLPGFVLGFISFRSLEKYRDSYVVRSVLRGTKGVSIALMAFALAVFVRSIADDVLNAMLVNGS